MRFFANKIVNPVGGGPTFDEWVNDLLNKTASEAKPECDDDPRGQCRGQEINNDNEDGSGYQKGESVDGKKDQGGNARKDTGGTTDQKDNKQSDKGASAKKNTKQAKCGKEMGESSDAGKVTEKHTDAGPGDDENPNPKLNINNDPNYQKGESVDPAKAVGKGKKQPGEPVVGKAASAGGFKKVASLNRPEKMRLFASLSSNKKNPLAYVEAMVGLKFANMTEEEKRWFKEFWGVLYPPEYVAEMVKDR